MSNPKQDPSSVHERHTGPRCPQVDAFSASLSADQEARREASTYPGRMTEATAGAVMHMMHPARPSACVTQPAQTSFLTQFARSQKIPGNTYRRNSLR